MRAVLLVVLMSLALIACAMCGGCVSAQDRADLDVTVKRQKEVAKEMFDAGMALIEELQAIKAKGSAGTLTVNEVESAISFAEKKAEMILENLKYERGALRDEEKRLRDKGYSGWEIAAAFVGSALFGSGGGALITQKIRGSIHNRNGDIGVRGPGVT